MHLLKNRNIENEQSIWEVRSVMASKFYSNSFKNQTSDIYI